MYKKLFLYLFIFGLLLLPFFHQEFIAFITGNPIRDMQGAGEGMIRAFNRFISG